MIPSQPPPSYNSIFPVSGETPPPRPDPPRVLLQVEFGLSLYSVFKNLVSIFFAIILALVLNLALANLVLIRTLAPCCWRNIKRHSEHLSVWQSEHRSTDWRWPVWVWAQVQIFLFAKLTLPARGQYLSQLEIWFQKINLFHFYLNGYSRRNGESLERRLWRLH